MGYSILRTFSLRFAEGPDQSFFDDGLEGWGHREHFTQPAGWDNRDDPWLEGLVGGADPEEDEDTDEDGDLDEDDDLGEDDDLDEDDLDDDLDDEEYDEDEDYDVYSDFDGEDDDWD